MKAFADALVSDARNKIIPEDKDWFGPLVGDWDFEWIDCAGPNKGRRIKGEWLFSRTMDGTAIQDMFICPSRAERDTERYPDAEYGTTIRIYNPKNESYDIFYGCTGEATRLEALMEDGKIVLTECSKKKMKWIFSDITETTFHWEKVASEDGENWILLGDVYASRKANE